MFLLLTTALKGTAKLARYFGKRQKSELRNTHSKVNDLNCYHIKAPCGSTKTRLNYNNVFNIFSQSTLLLADILSVIVSRVR